VGVVGSKDHPANLGRLCVKGSALHETVDPAGRMLVPQVDGEAVDWDTALDTVADGFRRVIDEHGPNAVAMYVSGQLLTEDYYAANKLMKGFIGTANIDTNSRLCMASAVVGLAAAKRARPQMRVVVIDPRQTATCDIADLHLAIAPGSDAFLFNGLLARLADDNAIDTAYINAHTEGFAQAIAAARADAPDIGAVARSTGVDIEDLHIFFDWFASRERTVTIYSQGVNQSSTWISSNRARSSASDASGGLPPWRMHRVSRPPTCSRRWSPGKSRQSGSWRPTRW
jgi:assimilatory nitrate reductase catalytic subunit